MRSGEKEKRRRGEFGFSPPLLFSSSPLPRLKTL
jgi:hypothetical protein